MNLETRTFIWGLTLMIVCGFGAASHIVNFMNGTFGHCWDWVLFIGCLCGVITGGSKIYKTTK